MSRIIFVLLFAATAFGQNWIEQRTFLRSGEAAARIDGLLTRGFTKKLGGFAWFQVQNGYSQVYGGVTFSPKPWIQLAAGPGLEEAGTPARVGGFVWMGGSKYSLLFVPEYGGSGFWWKLEAGRKVGKSANVGLLSERFKGTGPRMEVKIPKIPFAVWVAPLLDRELAARHPRLNALFGLRWYL